jgi:hypothetical protein
MKMQPFLQKTVFHALTLVLFIALSYIYLFPLLEGKQIAQHDIQSFTGMSKELADYRQETGREAIWTNSMFGGMPGFMISVVYANNVLTYLQSAFRSLFHPAAMLILYMLGFYILLNSIKVKRELAALGAMAFGFSSYHLIIIQAGHNSKAYAIGYLMLVIAGVLMAYRHNRIKGSLLLAFGLSLEIMAGHPQITYYGLLALVVFGVTELIVSVREKRIPGFLKTTGMLAAAALLAVAVNFSYLYTTWEYSKKTIRGKSELTYNSENKTSGLDKDYVVQWSQGIGETLTLLIPNFKGGSHDTNPGIDSESYRALQNRVENPRQVINQVIMYHGEKPFTSGPYYAGAIIIFLFVLGLFLVRGADKWWLLAATIVSVVLSWGKYVMPLTSFLLDYLPLYNKFRAPEMTLVIAGFTLPLLGFMALQQVITGQVTSVVLRKSLKWAFGITGGITLAFALVPGIAGDFAAPFDGAYPDWLTEAVRSDRSAILRADALRSFILIALAAGTLYLWHLKKINIKILIGTLAVLIVTDLWVIDKRYLNAGNFVTKREAGAIYQPAAADLEILKDKDLSYRVLPLQNPWADSRASYFHKNVGGYHAAKLRRYQEMIEHHFTPEIEKMIDGLRNEKPASEVFADLPAINMMNTRYIIYDLNAPPLVNPNALGNAWFAENFIIVPDADTEIEDLKSINPAATAIVDQRFAEHLQGKTFNPDTASFIRLTEYQPNYLRYESNTASEQLVVFSEIYYRDGWKSFVDGKEYPHFRANYILRAMVVPAGNHVLEFRFEPESFLKGNKVSLAGSILLFLAVALYAWSLRRRGLNSKMGRSGDM